MVVQVAMEMTLDEWKAMQEMNRPKAEFNIRKAVDKIPSKAKVIHQSKNPEARTRLWSFNENICSQELGSVWLQSRRPPQTPSEHQNGDLFSV